jgi:TolA-binding protein
VKKVIPVLAILIGAVGTSGCATRQFVRDEVAVVSQRVDSLESRLQETDGTARSALQQAQAANGQVQNNTQRLDQLNSRVDGMEQQMQTRARRPRG